MKTYRDQINSRLRWHPWLLPFVPLMAAVFAACVLITLDLIYLAIVIPIPLAAWGIYATVKLGTCPNCNSVLFALFGYHTKIYISRSLLPEKVKYCPICGLDFDQACLENKPGSER